MTENKIKNGDVFDIGQTVNGISKFIWLGGKWHYFNNEVDREYEYDHDGLTKLILDDYTDYGKDGWCIFLGNIFDFI